MDTKTIHISDIYLINFKTDKYVKIHKHPYYLSLLNKDKSTFKNYICYSKHQSEKPSGKWHKFYDIYKTIKNKGFDFSNSDKITVIEEHEQHRCIHGRHRICMLRKIFGENLYVKVENNKLIEFIIK
jgi:hypothetical protein